MRQYVYKIITDIPREILYQAIIQINRWPEWDDDVAAATLKVAMFHGARFKTAVKSGLKLPMLIETADGPDRFAVVAILLFARIRTARDFKQVEGGTEVLTTIQVWGPLGFLWDRLVARRQAARMAALTARFLVFAAA